MRALAGVVLFGSMLLGREAAAGTWKEAAASFIMAPARIEALQWLGGCWKRTTPRRVVEEQWMAPGAGLMLGMGRTTNAAGDTLSEYEQTRIEQRGDRLAFTASPSGQATDSFTSIELTDSLVVFENKEHDFPQRIGYRLLPDGNLSAWVEGVRAGKLHRNDFPYRRVPCPTGPK